MTHSSASTSRPRRQARPDARSTEARAQASPAGARRRSPFRRVLRGWALWTTAWWLIVGALLAPVVPGGWLFVAALAIVAALPLIALVRGFGQRRYPSALVRLFVIRPFWYAQLLLPLAATAGLVGALIGTPFGAAGTLGRAALGAMAAIFGITMLAGYVGSRRLVVRERRIAIPSLPAALRGLRIVQISDVHVGPHTSRRFLARVARAVREAQPDLIAITGDQVDDFAYDVRYFAEAFRGLSAPLGVFAVAGNHDIYAGWSGVREGLEAMPLRVLVNEAVALERGGTRFWLAGTGDPAGRHWSRDGGASAGPDPDRTMAPVPAGEPAIVLAHNPVLWPALADRGATLTLSGHTHHGQFSIPSLGWSLVSPFAEHAMGLYTRGAATLYVHPGTNYWGIPFRLGALPEVAVIVLEDGATS